MIGWGNSELSSEKKAAKKPVGEPAWTPKQKLARGDVRGLRGLELCARARLGPGPIRANRLENNNKQSAPVTWMPPTELPGIRKTAGQPEKTNSFVFRLACGFSLYALRTAGPALLACPEAVDSILVSVCFCCFYGVKRRFSASLLTQKRRVPVRSLPRPISVCRF